MSFLTLKLDCGDSHKHLIDAPRKLLILSPLNNEETGASSSAASGMEIEGLSLDAVLHQLYRKLLEHGQSAGGTRGDHRELLGVTLRISKPRARISRSENRGKPFSALGELIWYLSGSDTLEFIEPYVSRYADDAVNGILEGA